MQTSEDGLELLIENEEEPFSEDSDDDFQDDENDDEGDLKKPEPARAWHDVLGVSLKASLTEIKAARNERAKQFHSDRLKGVEGLSPEFEELANKRMAEINQAYEEAIANLRQNT